MTLSPRRGDIRFEAEWITKQHSDPAGEWNPDRDEYSVSYHASREEAECAAIAGSKQADQTEWIRVAEERFNGFEWIDVKRWTGDWTNGLLEPPIFCDEEAA